MNTLAVLYGGNLSAPAFEPLFSPPQGRGTAPVNALRLALEHAAAFPGVRNILVLVSEGFEAARIPRSIAAGDIPITLSASPGWTKKQLLDVLASHAGGYDLIYYAWADCPLLDPDLAAALVDRHTRFAAEYTYADGWPYGFAPELLAPSAPGLLGRIIGGDDGPVGRDALFSVLQKDINAFDIEAEIAPADLRSHRLTLAADSKRNLLLLTRLTAAGLRRAQDAERIIGERPELLRTLPSFFAIQAAVPCPQRCAYCPYPAFASGAPEFLDTARFEALLDQIAAFSADGVIDLSLWGELALHPQKLDLIRMVLARKELALIIESSGLGWKPEELETLAAVAAERGRALSGPLLAPPLSWIVSLDTADPGEYQALRGAGFAEAQETAGLLLRLFPGDTYVQAVRMKDREDDIERFYRHWKASGASIIIQKYDDFCGFLPKKQAADLAPVQRRPCWHLMRDMNILINGDVPLCREYTAALGYAGSPGDGNLAEGRILGNVFQESLETIWSRGAGPYQEHCSQVYAGICADCDEYYTFNF
ncbi:MAG: spiro-SPASM protein [Treponema sp.]|jgi:spiro-SPASM protein|nr:spiro-SPASM protein [Treponema sp.]